FQEKLDGQRWLLFRNFYFEASRKAKLQITSLSGCVASKDELERMDSLPTTEAGMESWITEIELADPVDSIQVDAVLYMLTEACGASNFDSVENGALYTHLENYFNSNRRTNPLNLLLEEDMET